MRYVRLVLLALFALAAVVMTWVNTDPVELNYLVATVSVPLPVALWASVVVGVVLGLLASLGVIIRLKRENAQLTRANRLVETEVNNLRSLPIKDGR